MPNKLFYELDEEKRARVFNAVLEEFARYSYHESSTNRIVEKAGIGKGSLFKYFRDKKDMYFFILDTVIEEFKIHLEGEFTNLPKDLFPRAVQYAELEFAWYIENPEKYKLLEKALVKNDAEIFYETEKRYNLQGEEFYYRIFEDIDTKEFKYKKEELLNILKWFLKGFNDQFIEEMQMQDDISGLKDAYMSRLIRYIEILKAGLQ